MEKGYQRLCQIGISHDGRATLHIFTWLSNLIVKRNATWINENLHPSGECLVYENLHSPASLTIHFLTYMTSSKI